MDKFDEQSGDLRTWLKKFKEIVWDIELISAGSLGFILYYNVQREIL